MKTTTTPAIAADLDLVVEMAQQIESTDPIDWGMLSIDEKTAYKLIAANLIEHFSTLNASERDLAMLSTVVKLTVENFVLNLKLLQSNQRHNHHQQQ